MSAPTDEKKYWLDDPKNVNKLIMGLVVVCVALVVADLFYHKHGHYGFETWIGFHAAYGFLAYVLLIHVAKIFRMLVKRDEDYYD